MMGWIRRLRPLALLLLAAGLACSRENAAPPRTATAPPVTTAATPAPAPAAPAAAAGKDSYDDALLWLRSTPGFAFTLREGEVTVDGEMTRPRVGIEQVTFRSGGEEWRGEATSRGLVWSKRNGEAWTEAAPPDFAGRVFQRVTFAFDPQKKEGAAQLVSSDAASHLYRFTDANSGNVHELRVRRGDGRIESMKIGEAVELTIR